MRSRNTEAARLQEDYLRRLRAALAGREPIDTTEILASVKEHIEEALGEAGEGEVSMVEMAGVLERLGTPEEYASELPAPQPREAAQEPLTGFHKFDIGSCFNDAIEMYRRNFVQLVLVAIIYEVLASFTLLILAGPLTGGVYYMCLRAMERPDKRVDVGDMFRAFHKFWPLLGLFFIQIICVVTGFAILLLPGVLLVTIWLFTDLLVIDKNVGVFEALGKSFSIVCRKGFFTNLLIGVIVVALIFGALSVPYAGFVLAWFAYPLCWMLITSAYVRQVRYDNGELDHLFLEPTGSAAPPAG